MKDTRKTTRDKENEISILNVIFLVGIADGQPVKVGER